jgi:hypothetical protein
MKNTFRHEIGVPEGFYPGEWMRKKLRGNSQDDSPDFGVEFKRKTA